MSAGLIVHAKYVSVSPLSTKTGKPTTSSVTPSCHRKSRAKPVVGRSAVAWEASIRGTGTPAARKRRASGAYL